MAYPAPPNYLPVVFPVMLSGAPDSPRGGLTPLMGSPVSTPTAMMFPQTPFAQHGTAGPFAPAQGQGIPVMRNGSISGAPPGASGAPGHDASSAFFHPLLNGFNGFNGFGAPPPPGMAPGTYVAPGSPKAVPIAPTGPKQPRNSAAGDKGRPYQPSPLKPGMRKSSSNGGAAGVTLTPTGAGTGTNTFLPSVVNSAVRPSSASASTGSGVGAGVAGSTTSSPLPAAPAVPSSTPSSGVTRSAYRQQQQTQHHAAANGYHTPASTGSGYHRSHGALASLTGGPDGEVGEMSPIAPSSTASSHIQIAAPVSPDPAVPSYSSNSATRPSMTGGVSAGATPATRDGGLDPATAAAAAAVVAAAAAVANGLSGQPTPRTSYTGLAAAASASAPRTSMSDGLAAANAATRASNSNLAAAAAAAAALSNVPPPITIPDDPSVAVTASGGIDADGVTISAGDVDVPAYGNFGSNGHYGGNAAAAAAAAAWGFYDASAAAAQGIGSPQMWPGVMPRLYGAAPAAMMPAISHHPHQQQAAAMAAAMAQQAAPQHSAAAAAAMQQPALLQAAMLQQLAAAMPQPITATAMHAMPCYVAPIDTDYMAAAEHIAQLQAQLLAQQNLRAAAAAVADMQHPVMAAAAGLTPGGMLAANPALFTAGALAGGHQGHHVSYPHGGMGMSMGMGGGMGMGMGMGAPARSRRRPNSNGASINNGGEQGPLYNPDGTVRLNARQRRTLRRAKERAIRGLLEAGKLLVARTMGEGAEGEDGVGSDLPSGGYDSDGDDELQGEDVDSPARPAAASPAPGAAAGVASARGSPSATMSGSPAEAAAKVVSAMTPVQAAASPAAAVVAAGGQQLLANHVGATGVNHSACSSNASASSVCEAASSGNGAVSNSSSLVGQEAPSGAGGTPISSKTLPQSPTEALHESSPAAAVTPATVPRSGSAAAAAAARASPPSAAKAPAVGGSSPAGAAAAVAAAALASGCASDADIAALIQQLNQKRDEGLVDEKLLRDLEIINNLIGALKTSGPSTTPSYNAQGRKPSGPPHHAHGGHAHVHTHSHGHAAFQSYQATNQANLHQAMQFLGAGGAVPKLPRGYAVGY